MENGYWKGQVDQTLKFNDKEHERIHDAVCELRNEVVGLKVSSAKAGGKWGAVTAAIMSFVMMVAAWVWNRICTF